MNPWAKATIATFREAIGTEEIENRFFRDKNQGLFEILDRLSPSEASKRVPGCNSIVGHTRHMLKYIEGDVAAIHGEVEETDWEETWAIQEANEEQWADLRAKLRSICEEWMRLIEANPSWENPDWMRGAISSAAHAAYHLGAIRQLASTMIQFP